MSAYPTRADEIREARRALRFFGRCFRPGNEFCAATDGEVVFLVARGRFARLLNATIKRWGGYGPDLVP